MATWNLVEGMWRPPLMRRRYFYPPLASHPPDWAADDEVRDVDAGAWRFSEFRELDDTAAGEVVRDLALRVVAVLPQGGFTDERGLPDPRIRLHAVGGGRVRCRPQPPIGRPMLDLFLLAFAFPLGWMPQLRWWQRWVEADRIPESVTYENADLDHLRSRLEALPTDEEEPDGAVAQGMRFPPEVAAADKQAFIDDFLAGDPDTFLEVRPGAYLGRADVVAQDPDGDAPDDATPAGSREVVLHARYADDSHDDPRPMNPRELLSLLFGDDSPEAGAHPFLRAMDDAAHADEQEALQAANGNHRQVPPRTRRMFLRPPLRTWKRVEWEAEQEIRPDIPLPGDAAGIAAHRSTAWSRTSALDANIMFNTVSREVDAVRTYNRIGYQGSWKCNLFVYDIAVRAGFRVGIHPVGQGPPTAFWHYLDSNATAHVVVRDLLVSGMPGEDRRALMGSNHFAFGNDADRRWGLNLEGALRHHADAHMGSLSGTVADATSGELIVGAQVTVAGTPLSATTADDGTYTIAHVPAGTHAVTATAFGRDPVTLPDIAVNTWQATVVNVGLPASQAAEHGGISGTVLDTVFQNPLAGAQVTVEGLGLSATTAEDGTFQLAQVPAGTRALSAAGAEHGPVTLHGVDVQANATVGVQLDLPPREHSALGAYLNRQLHEEGRCMVLVGARPRRFLNNACALRPTGIGHIVLVKEILPAPGAWGDGQSPLLVNRAAVDEGEDFGLRRVRLRTWEAVGAGARSRVFAPQVGGPSANAADGLGFIPGRVHLMELHPGADPDTPQGLRDLNVIHVHRNLLGIGGNLPAASVAATVRAHIRDLEGARDRQIGGGQCCRDSYRPGIGDDAHTGTMGAPAVQGACGGGG